MLSAPELGRRIDLPLGDLTFGRESHCDVVVPLGGVSRVHCSIRRDAAGTWLRDLGSTNGTQHNGATVRPHEDVRLAGGDLVAVGGAVFKVLDSGSAELDYHAQVFRTLALDDLTRVHNQRKLQDALESEIARCTRHRHTFSLLLADIDRFKEINDRYGHLCGDRVLQHIAVLLAHQGRRENCTARFGGDEFAIVLAETPLPGALVFAERVRGAIESEAFGAGAARIEITVSIGVAEWMPSMRRPEDLIAVADAALYRAKHAGRNRIASEDRPR
jgi:diguanylate cyclase (GGDEF)-like protein